MARTMRELIGIRNRQRDYLPEGRPLDQYSDAQRVEMTQDVHNPDSRNTPFGGTFVRNPDGSVSARAPSPETLDRRDRAWQAVDEAAGQQGAAVFESPLYRDAMLASAEAQGLDVSQYRDPLVLRDADATRDFDIMYGDVMRESDRQDAIHEKYMSVPAQFGKDGKPVAYRYTPRQSFRNQMNSQDRRVRSQQLFRNILDQHGRYVGPEMREELRAKADAGDMHGLRQAKNKLLADRRGNAAKNVADNWENINITRTLNNPDKAPGFIVRSTQGVAPHDRAALYTVLGWEPAAARETQAGIARDAYDTQAAIASQQGGAAAPEDKSVGAQSDRHFAMIDLNLQRGDVNRAIAQHAAFIGAAFPDSGRDAALKQAETEVFDRMAGMPQYRSNVRVRNRLVEMAKQGLDAFMSYASRVGIPTQEAKTLYDTMKGNDPSPATAGVNPITGR